MSLHGATLHEHINVIEVKGEKYGVPIADGGGSHNERPSWAHYLGGRLVVHIPATEPIKAAMVPAVVGKPGLMKGLIRAHCQKVDFLLHDELFDFDRTSPRSAT